MITNETLDEVITIAKDVVRQAERVKHQQAKIYAFRKRFPNRFMEMSEEDRKLY